MTRKLILRNSAAAVFISARALVPINLEQDNTIVRGQFTSPFHLARTSLLHATHGQTYRNTITGTACNHHDFRTLSRTLAGRAFREAHDGRRSRVTKVIETSGQKTEKYTSPAGIVPYGPDDKTRRVKILKPDPLPLGRLLLKVASVPKPEKTKRAQKQRTREKKKATKSTHLVNERRVQGNGDTLAYQHYRSPKAQKSIASFSYPVQRCGTI